jgi:hypothetical protein
MSTMTNLYSTYEAAVELELTHGRIRQICRWSEGKIGKKMGRDWWLTDSDLELIRIKFPKKTSESE